MVPQWIKLSPHIQGGEVTITISPGDGPETTITMITEAHTPESAATLFAWNLLNTTQDVIARETHEPWPIAVASSRAETLTPPPMALPFAIVRDDQMMMGYGEETAPTLAVDPIPLVEIIEPIPQP